MEEQKSERGKKKRTECDNVYSMQLCVRDYHLYALDSRLSARRCASGQATAVKLFLLFFCFGFRKPRRGLHHISTESFNSRVSRMYLEFKINKIIVPVVGDDGF